MTGTDASPVGDGTIQAADPIVRYREADQSAGDGRGVVVNVTLPLSVSDLTVAWHRKPVIWDVDLQVQPGQLVGVVGPNGAGKSTICALIIGSQKPDSGKINRANRLSIAILELRELLLQQCNPAACTSRRRIIHNIKVHS